MADFEYLRAFLATYRSGSVTKAAEYVHLSQPAVSGQIKALEQQLGRTLFTRTPRGIVPTAAAHDLARSIAPHIDALETAGDQSGQSTEIQGTVQIGGPVEFLTQRVLPSLASLIRLGLYLRVTLGSSDDLLQSLIDNDLDLAVVGAYNKKMRGVDFEPLYVEELVLVAAPSWMNHIPKRGEVNVRYLDGIPLLAYGEDMPQIQEFWESVFELAAHSPGRHRAKPARPNDNGDRGRRHDSSSTLLLRCRTSQWRSHRIGRTANTAVQPVNAGVNKP